MSAWSGGRYGARGSLEVRSRPRPAVRAGQVTVNGFVLSEEPLSLAELNGLYRTGPIQLRLTVGQAAWGGSGPFDTRLLDKERAG